MLQTRTCPVCNARRQPFDGPQGSVQWQSAGTGAKIETLASGFRGLFRSCAFGSSSFGLFMGARQAHLRHAEADANGGACDHTGCHKRQHAADGTSRLRRD